MTQGMRVPIEIQQQNDTAKNGYSKNFSSPVMGKKSKEWQVLPPCFVWVVWVSDKSRTHPE
jgi:hypothetical protein